MIFKLEIMLLEDKDLNLKLSYVHHALLPINKEYLIIVKQSQL